MAPRKRRPTDVGLSHGDGHGDRAHGDHFDGAAGPAMAEDSVMAEFQARLEVLLERHEAGIARRLTTALEEPRRKEKE